jgi:gentisate 1,2-dioxygenase
MEAFFDKPLVTPERAKFYDRLSTSNLAPLWENMANLVTPEPRSACVPALWAYDQVRPLLMEGAQLITAQEAERRVLILENPGIKGQSQITQSLYAGLQLVMPGEIAPSHRHTASALRFIVEGSGAYTAVAGERVRMEPGDFVITPSWTFHDHGNDGREPVVWLDGLDVPIVNIFDTSFAERGAEEVQPVAREAGISELRYGHNLLPFDYRLSGLNSPIFHYSYRRSREVLRGLLAHDEANRYHGVKLQYANPATGNATMPTMGAFIQALPAGFHGDAYRCTDATVYCVAEGSGSTQIGSMSLNWKPRDVFVVPSWAQVIHQADEEAILFSFSDRPAQQALGLWRELVC